jgi:hypothetical protein
MCKKNASLMCKEKDKPVNHWKQAILHAEEMASAAERRATELRKAAQAFRELQASGEPFPGEREFLGQDSDL